MSAPARFGHAAGRANAKPSPPPRTSESFPQRRAGDDEQETALK